MQKRRFPNSSVACGCVTPGSRRGRRGAGRASFRHYRHRFPATLRGEVAGASPGPARGRLVHYSSARQPCRRTGRLPRRSIDGSIMATWRLTSPAQPFVPASALTHRLPPFAGDASPRAIRNGVSISRATQAPALPELPLLRNAPPGGETIVAGALRGASPGLALAAGGPACRARSPTGPRATASTAARVPHLITERRRCGCPRGAGQQSCPGQGVQRRPMSSPSPGSSVLASAPIQ